MRTDLERICQVPYKRKAYPYQFRTGSKRIRSRVNAALVFMWKTEMKSSPVIRFKKKYHDYIYTIKVLAQLKNTVYL